MLSIRTQDRMGLVPYDSAIKISEAYEPRSGNYHISKSNGILGTYKNKARALEVLDEIERVCVGRILIPQSNSSSDMNEYTIYTTKTKQEEIILMPTVYQMPKE